MSSSTNNINTYATKGSVIVMTENTDKKKKDTVEIPKELYSRYLSFIEQGSNSEEEYKKCSFAAEIGLINIWVYHCIRCNYLWIPKDFDYNGNEDIFFDVEPPKSCARCKSKYWNKIPRRETENVDRMASIARLRALHRNEMKE